MVIFNRWLEKLNFNVMAISQRKIPIFFILFILHPINLALKLILMDQTDLLENPIKACAGRLVDSRP